MGIKDRLKGLVSPIDDEDIEIEMDQEEIEALSDYEKKPKKGASKLPTDTKMILFEPRAYEEAQDIARFLKDKKAAVVNLHRLKRDYAQRTIDFLLGVVFALDGSIQKIGDDVYLCTPNTIGVQGEISLEGEDEE